MNSWANILIAEDDENDRILMERALDKAGIRSATAFASDGQETIDILEHINPPAAAGGFHPNVLLLNIRLPRINGFQVLEWLKQHPSSRPERVMMFSSSSDPMDIEHALALGADDYKIKPNDTSGYAKLIEGVKVQMSGAQASQSLS